MPPLCSQLEGLESRHKTELATHFRTQEKELETLKSTYEKEMERLRTRHKAESDQRVRNFASSLVSRPSLTAASKKL